MAWRAHSFPQPRVYENSTKGAMPRILLHAPSYCSSCGTWYLAGHPLTGRRVLHQLQDFCIATYMCPHNIGPVATFLMLTRACSSFSNPCSKVVHRPLRLRIRGTNFSDRSKHHSHGTNDLTIIRYMGNSRIKTLSLCCFGCYESICIVF